MDGGVGEGLGPLSCIPHPLVAFLKYDHPTLLEWVGSVEQACSTGHQYLPED